MCLQCVVNAVSLITDVIPGFTLMQSQVDNEEWPKGWYGLVESNDPTFVFPGPICLDTSADISDQELNAMADYPAGYNEYCQAADILGEHLNGDVMAGYRLVRACLKVGYSLTEGSVSYWLMQHMAKKMPG